MPLKVTTYEAIKTLITEEKVYANLLEDIKYTFKEEISSPRRYGCIKTLPDLIDHLERLDILSECNIEPLCRIGEFFADDMLDMALEKYEEPPEEYDVNMYALQRVQEINSKIGLPIVNQKAQVVQQQQTLIQPEFTQNKRNAIYRYVAEEIGRNWRFLGIGLDVKAGVLDSIERKHMDLMSRVYEIFDIFENDPRHRAKDHFFIICEALDLCKRKDIRRGIEKIMLNDDLS